MVREVLQADENVAYCIVLEGETWHVPYSKRGNLNIDRIGRARG